MKKLVLLVLVMFAVATVAYSCHVPEPPVVPPVQNNTTDPIQNDTNYSEISNSSTNVPEFPDSSEPVTIGMQETR